MSTLLQAFEDLADASVARQPRAACFSCGRPFVFALGPVGTVYTEAGAAETRISGMCENCFDNLFVGMDDEEGEDE